MIHVRGIGTRGLCALLLIAGVLSMHGIPSTGTAHAGESDSSAPMLHGVTAISLDESVGLLSGVAVASAVALEPFAAGRPSDLPHEGTSHLWAACLAVLLAGMLLIGAAVLVRRRVREREAAAIWPVVGWGLTRYRLPRPPDLFALCVMRT
ncbi:hypothetical protein DQ237_00840 [Blastococcus sp. TF02-8]|nr:hypothetical protein DQ237_00840 [Blastococcus sp. TF02-8]